MGLLNHLPYAAGIYHLYTREHPPPDGRQQVFTCCPSYADLVVRLRSCLYQCVCQNLTNRFYSLWTLKSILLTFYSQIVRELWHGIAIVHIVAVIFAITYCVSIILIFVECTPFSLYWAIIPDPGSSCPNRGCLSTAD